jgi:hypothetical protein
MGGKIIFNKKEPFFESFPGTFALFQHSCCEYSEPEFYF